MKPAAHLTLNLGMRPAAHLTLNLGMRPAAPLTWNFDLELAEGGRVIRQAAHLTLNLQLRGLTPSKGSVGPGPYAHHRGATAQPPLSLGPPLCDGSKEPHPHSRNFGALGPQAGTLAAGSPHGGTGPQHGHLGVPLSHICALSPPLGEVRGLY